MEVLFISSLEEKTLFKTAEITKWSSYQFPSSLQMKNNQTTIELEMEKEPPKPDTSKVPEDDTQNNGNSMLVGGIKTKLLQTFNFCISFWMLGQSLSSYHL